MRFEFATAAQIIFGPGTVKEVPLLAAELVKSAVPPAGKRACVVTGRTIDRAKPLIETLNKQAIECTAFSVYGEPTTTIAKQGIELARKSKCGLVISVGGGSALDTGKVIAAMLTNSGELEDYLEVVGAGKQLLRTPVPHLAIPTTAGTGAEVTRNAVLSVPECKVKVSMRSPLMLPRLVVVDPELTYSMPPSVTASTGLDTLTQLIEPYVSNKANPLTDGLCRGGLKRAACSLRQAYEDGGKAARENMSVASLFSGLALANAKLGAVHGFAGPLGGMISAPHGAICAKLLPHVMEANLKALQQRAADSPALGRYDEIAQLLTGLPTARAVDGVKWVQDLCAVLSVPSLSEFGLKEQDFSNVVTKAQKSSSMKGNPIKLTDDELTDILRAACMYST